MPTNASSARHWFTGLLSSVITDITAASTLPPKSLCAHCASANVSDKWSRPAYVMRNQRFRKAVGSDEAVWNLGLVVAYIVP